jgi:hypothetical protein
VREFFGIPEAKDLRDDEAELTKFVPLQQQKEEELEKIRREQNKKTRQKASKKSWF